MDDDEHDKILKAKGNKTWLEFIRECAKLMNKEKKE